MSYRGATATIPAGRGSLNGNANLTEIPATDLQEAEGIVYEDRVWRKEPGAVTFDAAGVSGDPAILAGYDYWPDESTQRMILACADGKLYKEVAGDTDSVTLKTGLSATARGKLVEAGAEGTGDVRQLIYFTGENPPQVVSGDAAAAANLATPPADWTGANQPVGGAVHGGGLWGWGNANAPHQVYRSSTENHGDFLAAPVVSMTVWPGVGRRIMCGLDFNGKLVLFKYPKGIYALDDSDVRPSYWVFTPVTDSIGVCKSPHAALAVLRDILFLSADGGFHLLSAISDKDVRRSDLSERLNIKGWIRENINLSRLSQVVSSWFEHKSLAVFALPRTGETANSARLMFDFSQYEQEGRVGFSYSFRDDASALWLRKGADGVERPVAGDSLGDVYLLDQATRSKNGAAYTGKHRTAETDLAFLDPSLATKMKNYDFLELVFNPKSPSDVTVTTYLDGTAKQVLTFDGTRRTDKARIRGASQYFSYQAKNTVAGEDFSIVAARLYFRPGREVPIRSGGATAPEQPSVSTNILRGYQAVAEGDISVTIINAGATGAYVPDITPSWNTTFWESAHLTGQFTFAFGTPAPSGGYVRWEIVPAP